MNTVAAQCCDRLDELEADHALLRTRLVSFISDLVVIGGGRVEFDHPVEMDENEDAHAVRLITAGDVGVPHLVVKKWPPFDTYFVFVLPLLRTKTLIQVAEAAVCAILGDSSRYENLQERMEKITWISKTL